MGTTVVRPTHMDESWTVPGVLGHAVRAFGARPCLQIVNGIAQSYSQLWTSVQDLARRLAGHGVAHQERVVLMLGNHHLSIHAWLAVNLIGAVDVSINTGYKGESLVHAVNLSEARTLLTTQDLLPTLLRTAAQLTLLRAIVVLDGEAASFRSPMPLRVVHWSALPLAPEEALAAPRPQPWDSASVIYTSGTSGPAKGVQMPHAQVTLLARLAAAKMTMSEQDVFFSFYPMYHMAGKFMSVLAAFSVGARLVLDAGFRPEEWLDRIRRYGATLTAAHGPMLEMVHALPATAQDRDHQLRLIRTAPFPKRIAQSFEQRFGVRGMEVWGMTETGVICWSDPAEPLRVGCCGQIDTEWYEFAVVDPQSDQPLPAGTVGEFVVRPRHPWTITQGYLGMPERTVQSWRNLWFHTGDCGYVDEGGHVYFVDRAKERIRRRAENISAGDIEAAALLHPDVAEAAATGVASGFEGDDDILLCLVLRPGRGFEPEALLSALLHELPHFMVPRYLRPCVSLPRTPTGKLQRSLLREVAMDAATWDRKAAGVELRALADEGARPEILFTNS